MKKAITLFLCIMLTTGMISGCAGREEETGSSEENTAAQEDKTDQDSQTEDQETEDDGSQEEQKEEPQDQQESGQGETDASQGEGQDRDMTEDLAMSVLKEQAGTVDYTSLEELNPEPGSRIAVVSKSTRDDFWTTVRSGIEDGVKALNEKWAIQAKTRSQYLLTDLQMIQMWRSRLI